MKMKGKGNSLGTPVIIRIVFLGLVAGIFGASFVVIRNRHIKKGDEIREAEKAILACNKEVEMLENRIDRLIGRADLGRHLRWIDSDLEEIDPTRVLIIRKDEELPALPKVAAMR